MTKPTDQPAPDRYRDIDTGLLVPATVGRDREPRFRYQERALSIWRGTWGGRTRLLRWRPTTPAMLQHLQRLGMTPERVGQHWFVGRDAVLRAELRVFESDNPNGLTRMPATTLSVIEVPDGALQLALQVQNA